MARMRLISHAPQLICVGVLTLAAKVSAQPTIDLRAVRVNDVPIEPTNDLLANPGDIVGAEFWIRDWSPNGQKLRGFQIVLDEEKLVGDSPDECGGLVPLGVDSPGYDCPCLSDEDCVGCSVAGATACYVVGSHCAGPTHNAELGAFINQFHFEIVEGVPENTYVFAPPEIVDPPIDISGVDRSLPGYRYGAILLGAGSAKVYTVPKYAATLKVRVAEDSHSGRGAFEVAARPVDYVGGPALTFLVDENGDYIEPLELVPLTVTVAGGCEIIDNICPIDSDPPDCAIDARQPADLDGTDSAGWDVVEMTLPFDPANLTGAEFWVQEVPTGFPPAIIAITALEGSKVRVAFSRPITAGKWTCINSNPGHCFDWHYCIAHLPGDVNGDGTANPADVLSLIDCLNGKRTCELHQCDIDRSGVCGPPDILRTIDLLNGASVYEPWLNRTLLPCPSP